MDEITKKRPISALSSILEIIQLHSEMVVPVAFASAICRDRDNDKFLEAAVAADADYVVTGDVALLSIKSYLRIEIVKPTQFLKLLPR